MRRVIRPIQVNGDLVHIPLTQGMTAIIDAGDAHLVDGRNWAVIRCRHLLYAKTSIRTPDGWRNLPLHRAILHPPANIQVDHINLDGLDNRRANLRLASIAENSRNQRRPSHNTSGFKGVYWDAERRKWRARITVDLQLRHLGDFDTPEDAHSAYCEASKRMHHAFGRTA